MSQPPLGEKAHHIGSDDEAQHIAEARQHHARLELGEDRQADGAFQRIEAKRRGAEARPVSRTDRQHGQVCNVIGTGTIGTFTCAAAATTSEPTSASTRLRRPEAGHSRSERRLAFMFIHPYPVETMVNVSLIGSRPASRNRR